LRFYVSVNQNSRDYFNNHSGRLSEEITYAPFVPYIPERREVEENYIPENRRLNRNRIESRRNNSNLINLYNIHAIPRKSQIKRRNYDLDVV